ncbi:Lrp/AsnC family transcriptional regulator [Mycetocola zhujimingii]|uniref:Lrp/AsnC family transcriptional regulator n=1 Tax=Mycetocola zhujimingii TaxID=2079792 RepID=A0A2U1TFM0_9MICO|nr:Lrp/AsnC family transcriptional regulator [Mycetocola zhujimingii]PWC07697.1 Lrp/AsnC family transcriptional regulator [Mycetocola zhujimingii]
MDDARAELPAPSLSGDGNADNSLVNVKLLDELSDLDRRIIVALQHDGRASWRAIAEMVDGTVPTVTRRGQHLLSSGVVKIVVMPTLGSSGAVDSFLVRINCAPGTQLQVAEELAGNRDVRFLTIVTGGYDVIAELVVHGGAAHYPQLIQQLQSIRGVERWRSDLIMHVYKVSFDWSRQLFDRTMHLPAQPVETHAAGIGKGCAPDHFDDQDRKILDFLKQDGRMAFKSVADGLGMNESSVRRRFERLRQNGCVDTLALVPASALGMGAETLLTVDVDPERLESVAQELATYPAVRYVAATLDRNSLFCEVITASTDDLHHFMTSTVSPLVGVRGWTAAMELLVLKRGFVETPWWRAQVGKPQI